MTKADIVNEISEKTGIEKMAVQATVEAFMKTIRNSMVEGKNVYLRGFGTFVVKKRAEKIFFKTKMRGNIPAVEAPGRARGGGKGIPSLC